MKLISHSLIHVCVLILTIRFMGLAKRVDYVDQPRLPAVPKQVNQERARVSSGCSAGETLPPETVYTLKLPEQPDFLMPYNLARLINGIDKEADGFFDLRPIWDRLGVTRDNEGAFDGISRAQNGPWTAQVLRGNNPNSGSLIILFISAAGGASRRYVVFRWGSTSWQVTGNVDILDYKYPGSPHQQYHGLVTNGQNTWLALRSLGASGTGVYQINEAWYEISGKRPRKVLEFPTEGHFVNDNVGVCNREFGSQIVAEKRLRGSYAVQVGFWVTFGPYGDGDWKFHRRKDATYVWNERGRQFVLDESTSNVSQEEIEDVFQTGFLTDSKFLIYNLSELSRIRERGSERKRMWLESLFSRMRSRE